MKLRELLRGVVVEGEIPEVDIAEVRDDSRAVGPGDLFVAQRGLTVDGHDFVGAVLARGAAAALVETVDPAVGGLQLKTPSTAKALALVAANRFGRPAEAMKLVGITGTNGKTTCTFLVESLLRHGGARPGVIGTVTYRYGEVSRPAPFTTPTPLELHATLDEMRRAGCTHVIMECSSHALASDRLHGLGFAVSAFTNLTQDHLDFHGTMAQYAEAKARLFRELTVGSAVILIDRPGGTAMAEAAGARARLVSATHRAEALVSVVASRQTLAGLEAELSTAQGPMALMSPLIGDFNLENLVVAVGIGLELGLGPAAMSACLATATGAPGRLERVPAPFGIFVDYAHTPDALIRVMATLRPLTDGRLIVVFGCGGDRDRTKRPIMGEAVGRDADLAIVTSDNPRTEEPGSILEMILEGVRRTSLPALTAAELGTRRGYIAEVDRRRAIGLAVAAARPGDVLLIAGKGHEDYQILGKTKIHFDDREEAADACRQLAAKI